MEVRRANVLLDHREDAIEVTARVADGAFKGLVAPDDGTVLGEGSDGNDDGAKGHPSMLTRRAGRKVGDQPTGGARRSRNRVGQRRRRSC
jgi:hypothetical protein